MGRAVSRVHPVMILSAALWARSSLSREDVLAVNKSPPYVRLNKNRELTNTCIIHAYIVAVILVYTRVGLFISAIVAQQESIWIDELTVSKTLIQAAYVFAICSKLA